MRIGVQIGPERGAYAQKVALYAERARAAEAAGFATIWTPQLPDDFDAMTAAALMAHATDRIEIGTAVVPVQSRHPVALAQEALSTQAVANGRFVLGVGPSHHWIVTDMLGLRYDRPAGLVRSHLEVLAPALAGPGRVDVTNADFDVHWSHDITDLPATPVLLAALGPTMLRIAGELAAGTILWMADERAVGEHIVPRITAAAVGRPQPRVVAGVPVVVCAANEVDEARAFTDRMLGYVDASPNYKRLLEQGNASRVSDLAAIGDEATVTARLHSYRDAGVTDLNAFVVAVGADRAAREQSRARTLAFLGDLAPEI